MCNETQYFVLQGADFKDNKTAKLEPHQEYYCFQDEQYHFDQYVGSLVKYSFSLPIGPNKIIQQENNNILD